MTAVAPELSVQNVVDDWDCVVIGAGPAGSLAARQAALLGLRTLLVERRSFPREKVCGACVNRRGLSVLESAGLGAVAGACGCVPLSQLRLLSGGRQLCVPLPGGAAVSRALLDSALAQAAVDAGAAFLPSTTAKVLPGVPGLAARAVRLASEGVGAGRRRPVEICAKAVVAADGLGSPSLRLLPEFAGRVAKASRIGAGAVLQDSSLAPPPGTIQMAAGRHGYVGMVRLAGDLLNVAAAVDPLAVKKERSLHDVVNQILRESRCPTLKAAECQWTATPPLTRSTSRVAAERVFVIGDAAGYVEPFTGEGMAWALAGGVLVAECVAEAVRRSPLAAARKWRQQWKRGIASRQHYCRGLAALLRRPLVMKVAMTVAAGFPGIAAPIVRRLNTPAPA